MLISKSGDYKKNKDKYIKRANKSYDNSFSSVSHRLRRMLTEAKSRSKNRNIEFNITENDIKWNSVCPVLGIPIIMSRSKENIRRNYFGPSIDRIDNSLGYIPGNVRLVSTRANIIKSNMTEDECRLLLENWHKI